MTIFFNTMSKYMELLSSYLTVAINCLHLKINMFALIFIVFSYPGVALAQNQVALEKGDLKAVFIDNSSYGKHPKGYNGISELYHKDQDSTLFIPAGVNLEHIFGGDHLESFFEPRTEPMTIERLSDTKVILHQPETSFSHVESWTIFQMVDPNYIDVDFRFVIHNEAMYNHRYIGLFWASYINYPEYIGINFKGKNKYSKYKSNWQYVYSEHHNENATHISDKDTFKPYMVPDFDVGLTVEISDYVYTEPYYYGRFHNMVLAYLFKEPKEGFIRFAKSPDSGAPGRAKPAWDFYYLLPDFEVGKEYSLKLRVVYKTWAGQKNIDEEYRKWATKSE